jgi:hypothetical protein
MHAPVAIAVPIAECRQMSGRDVVIGALAAWQRRRTPNGEVIKLKIARSTDAFDSGDLETVILGLNDRQLRAFARDLVLASVEHGLPIDGVRKWHMFGWSLVRREDDKHWSGWLDGGAVEGPDPD